MFNARLLVGSGAGAAGLWELWPGQAGWQAVFLGLGVMAALWFGLILVICAMDYRRRHAPAKMRPCSPDRRGQVFAHAEEAGAHRHAQREAAIARADQPHSVH